MFVFVFFLYLFYFDVCICICFSFVFVLYFVHVLSLKYLIHIMWYGCVNSFPFHLNCAKHKQWSWFEALSYMKSKFHMQIDEIRHGHAKIKHGRATWCSFHSKFLFHALRTLHSLSVGRKNKNFQVNFIYLVYFNVFRIFNSSRIVVVIFQ